MLAGLSLARRYKAMWSAAACRRCLPARLAGACTLHALNAPDRARQASLEYGGSKLPHSAWTRCYARRVTSREDNSLHDELDEKRAKAGLCADCMHSRVIRSDRPSEFYLCLMHSANPYYPKYPRLPVTSCAAYET